MDTLTFEVPCTPKQSSLVTILFVPLNCEAALNQNRLRNLLFLAKRCFHNNQYVPFILFGSPLYKIIFSVVLNSSLSTRNYLFSSLEKRSPKSNESRNIQQLTRDIKLCSININSIRGKKKTRTSVLFRNLWF